MEEHNRFSNRLEEQLDIPIFNISIPNNLEGYISLIQIAQNAGAEINRLIVGVCMENDIIYYQEHQSMGQYKRSVINYLNFATAKSFLANNSSIYMALSTLTHSRSMLKNAAHSLGLIVPNLDGIPNQAYRQESVDSSIDRLDKIRRTDNIVSTLVVVIPSRGLWVDSLKTNAERTHNAFVASLARRGFDFVDLRDEFENIGNPLSLHFQNDGHWNDSGHDLAAEVLSRHLEVYQ